MIVTRELNATGFVNNGQKLDKAGVHKLFNNPVYVGEATHTGESLSLEQRRPHEF